MNMRKSKTFSLLQEEGIIACLFYIFKKRKYKNIIRLRPYLCKLKIKFLKNYYPRFILTRDEFKIYQDLQKRFGENYDNIIRIDFSFFIRNLKNHLAWINSDELQNNIKSTQTNKDIYIPRFSTLNNSYTINHHTHTSPNTNKTFTPPPSSPLHSNMEELENNPEIKENSNSTINMQYTQEYPPLLNPKNLDYNNIPGDLAYWLNLTLPQNYQFIWISNGASASEATIVFLKHCKVNLAPYWKHESEKYKLDYELLMQNKDGYNILSIHPALITKKYLSLLPKKSIFFHVTCDPISRLRVGINHINNAKMQPIDTLPLHTPICNFFPPIYYHYANKKNQPDITQTGKIFPKYSNLYEILLDSQEYISEFYCIDVESLGLNSAFETFCILAKTFNFPQLPSDEFLFKQRVNMHRGGLCALPLHIYTQLTSGKNISFKIAAYRQTHENERKNDRAHDFFTKEFDIDGIRLMILIQESDYSSLKQDTVLLNTIKNFLHTYKEELEESVRKTKEVLLKEKDILEFLKQDKELQKQFHEKLYNEVMFFNTYYKDFTHSWKYYNELEGIQTKNHP